jgi:hypothetical protein
MFPENSASRVYKGKKSKVVLVLISYKLCNEDILGNGGIAPFFFTSALNGDE